MSKIVRHEFLGSWWAFWLLPLNRRDSLAFLYFVNSTLRVDTDMDEPEQLVETLRHRK
jgi:hypothetical protein